MRPLADSHDELDALIVHGRALLAHALRSGWARGLLLRTDDGMYAGVLGAAQLEQLLADEEAALKSERPQAPRGLPRLDALIDSIGAGPLAAEALAALSAVELDARARALAAYLRGGELGAALTVDVLDRALGDGATSGLLEALGAGAPLRRHRLVEVSDRAGELTVAATVRAAPRLLRWLLQPDELDAEIAPYATLHAPASSSELCAAARQAAAPIVDEVRAFVSARRNGAAVGDLVLRGPRGVGRREIAREACRLAGVPLLIASLPSLLGQPHPSEALAQVVREALLLDAELLLESAEVLAAPDEHTQRLRAALASAPRALLLSATGDPPRAGGRPLLQRDVPMLTPERREAVFAELLPEVSAGELASLYRVGLGAVARVCEGARVRAGLRGEPPTAADVAQAVRAEFETDLGTLATRVEVTQTWDDLVVPDDTGRTIAELVDQLRHRATVLGRWGFHRKLGKGLGTTALFTGEPGTGKSMVAGLIARTLGLELYQIDLSRVMSKWIGETEKNLARVFDAAETGHVVLLFDEADALLGRRTADVRSANDRYANLETNYILSRLEAFSGVAILTSNLETSIDPALARRLSFELRFPFPDERHRAELWKRMLPDELPVAGAIDFPLLATRFEIAGGHIRNIVLRAAYLAAADGTGALSMPHLLRAAESEYHDHGMLVAKGRLPT